MTQTSSVKNRVTAKLTYLTWALSITKSILVNKVIDLPFVSYYLIHFIQLLMALNSP